ncbi:titin homolog isoform X2 [Scylla paramamosain]|uniref:titin homolog isoform X2 n=1 Tax=Scylla paramamosain TaxID=85552 RepID=UPI003082C57D
MAHDALFDMKNPAMTLVWRTAFDPKMKREKIRKNREVRTVKVDKICDNLKQVIGDQGTKLDSRTFFKTSMILSGAQRIHSMQADLLLDDTKKLLNTMKKERKVMQKFDSVLDCRPSHAKTVRLPSLDITASPQTLRRPKATKVLDLDWHTLDCDIDWTSGPPRARMQDITLPDDDVPYSPQFMAELEHLRAQEANLEGPTLLDWEMNGFQADEESGEAAAVDTLLTAVPEEEQQQPVLPTMMVEAPVEAATLEEPAAPTVMITDEAPEEAATQEKLEVPTAPQPEDLQHSEQPTEPSQPEQPSQIELESLEGSDRQLPAPRVRQARPTIDPVCILSRDVMRMQIKEYIDTMRTQTSLGDTADLGKLHQARRDFFPTKPVHRRVIADVLVNLFRPCEGEAMFAEPESPLHQGAEEFVRDASHSEVKDLSSILSVHQDTTESSRSKTLLEAPSGLFEEVPSQLQPIEELESPMPPPSPREASSARKKPGSSPTKKRKRPSATEMPELEQEMPPVEEPVQKMATAEERAELSISSSSKDSMTKIDEMTEIILDFLERQPEVLFSDLLVEDAGDREAAAVFSHVLLMFKNGLLDLHQESGFGPISVSLPSADQE